MISTFIFEAGGERFGVHAECTLLPAMSFLQSRTQAARDGIGKAVPRAEDDRLLRGRGRYADDFNEPGQAHAYIARSPHAHARIRSVDAAAALALPGVLAVLTGRDALADGLRPVPYRPITANPHEVPLKNRDGAAVFLAPCAPLPADRARYVGAPVAMVIAETAALAKDAAEQLVIDYEVLPAVTATADAAQPRSPRVWDESANVCLDCDAGDAAAEVDRAFARAAHVVRLETTINRITGVPMEPRCALGVYDPASARYTVHASTGGVQRHRSEIAGALGIPESALRVVTRDLGGNYGTRNNSYPEFTLVAWAAKRVGRPVKWTCERQEAFLSDEHARDLVSHAELALDAEGNFLALRAENTSNVGAYAVSFIPLGKGIGVSTTVYRLPCAALRGRAVLSNTPPTTPYRAAGRPEVMFVMERLIELAARRHGFDRIELRRRNLVPTSAMPYRNRLGLVYDSGDYAATMLRAVALADWKGFEARRAQARARGRLRGIGLGNYVELNTGAPRERAEIRVLPEGRIEVVLGTLSSGQGHETSFAQVLVEWLGVELSQVRLITGDTDVAPIGGGTHSGRSMRMAAVVMAHACDQVVQKGTRIASQFLEAAEADIEFRNRRFSVKGTDRSVDLYKVAEIEPLGGMHDETVSVPSFPYGCAVCELEVDPDTGETQIVRYTSVDDCGRAVNPLILHGQTHGGIVAGVGQALMEQCVYDRESGQLLSASFMDYALPRADQFPFFDVELSEVPSSTNPLGMRGGGEGGTTPALASVVNALVDALAEFGVEHLELPATPEKVWRAIHGREAD
jgi:aerobic carbon-monoxide dehydrogenase large subunit